MRQDFCRLVSDAWYPESEASATQGTTHAHSYPNPSFTGHRWPILQAHSQMANYPGWDAPFSSGTAMGVSAVPAPGNGETFSLTFLMN